MCAYILHVCNLYACIYEYDNANHVIEIIHKQFVYVCAFIRLNLKKKNHLTCLQGLAEMWTSENCCFLLNSHSTSQTARNYYSGKKNQICDGRMFFLMYSHEYIHTYASRPKINYRAGAKHSEKKMSSTVSRSLHLTKTIGTSPQHKRVFRKGMRTKTVENKKWKPHVHEYGEGKSV